MSNNKLNKEDQAFQDKLNQAEFPYDEKAWQGVKEKLKHKNQAPSHKILIQAAAVLVVATAIVLVLQNQYKNTTKAPEEAAIEQKESMNFTNKDAVKSSEPEKEKSTHKVQAKSEKTKNTKHKSQTAQEPKAVNKTQNSEINEDLSEKNIPKKEEEKSNIEKAEKPFHQFTAFIHIEGKQCVGNQLKFWADCNEKGRTLKYYWKLNNQAIKKHNKSFEAKVTQAGENTVHLRIVNAEGQILSEFKNSFIVSNPPTVNFSYQDHKGILNDFVVSFETDNRRFKLPNEKIRWQVDGKRIKLDENAAYNFNKAGIYDVKMEAINQDGCISSIEKPVAVKADFKPLINAFTPNGDGKNDHFMPLGFEDFDGYFKFTVYQLNGTVVYETSDPGKAWNGKRHNKGTIMPAGNYIWKIELRKNDKQRNFSDRIKLLKID